MSDCLGKCTWTQFWECLPLLGSNQVSKRLSRRKLLQELEDQDQTGEKLLAKLSEPEKDALLRNLHVDERLDKMKLSTRLFMTFSIPLVENHVPVPCKDLRPPAVRYRWNESNTIKNETAGVVFPGEDEQSSHATKDLRSTPMVERAFLAAFNCLPIVDEVDDALQFQSVEEGVLFGQKILGPLLPKPRFVWEELHSDQAQADIAYAGVGQLYLRTSDVRGYEHMVDMRAMEGLHVRPAFEKYGAAAYFRNEAICGIARGGKLIEPGSDGWEHAKFAWRVSLFTYVTAVDHLMYSHLIVSNGINASLREMPAAHPVRRVLHVNIFGTSIINTKSNLTLAYEGGFLHRMTGFEWKEGLCNVIASGKDFKYETWPQRIASTKLSEYFKEKLPLLRGGLRVWKALHSFYQAYVDMYYRDDAAVQGDQYLRDYWRFRCTPMYTQGLPALSKSALVDQLTHACFYVTAYHQVAGDVVQYLTSPQGMFFQIRKNMTMADAEMMANTLTLTASTGRTMPPLVGDWSHLLDLTGDGEGWREVQEECNLLAPSFVEVKEAWERMQVDLKRVSAEIQAENKQSRLPFTEIDPISFECSVSI